jgi:hypothetical protein
MGYMKSRNPEGRTPLYGETKTRVNLSLTPTSVGGLDLVARSLNMTRSELVEHVGRQNIEVLRQLIDLADAQEIVSDSTNIHALVEGINT